VRVLVLGGGGREHALCWALSRSPSVDHLLCAPGNAGIADLAETCEVDATDVAAVRELAVDRHVDLVVVGPEAPLVAGVADTLGTAGVAVFGPTRDAARIEGSKSYAKEVMGAAGVVTARYWSGRDLDAAASALDGFAPPYVVKADGLAGGKGVSICGDRAAAEAAVRALLADQFTAGAAHPTVVIEEYLEGPEVSVFGLCDGERVVALAPAQDFKRAEDGDAGPNTGGMGAYCPVPAVGGALLDEVRTTILEPVVGELANRAARYVGVLYAGLVLTRDGPKVLEFNARFGDPETQAVLPRLRTDLAALLAACAHGELTGDVVEWDSRACVTVVLASGGYPGGYETGKPITGLDEASAVEDALVFHAGTRRDGADVLTAGGRVLTVSALGDSIEAARDRAYTAADRIRFDGLHRRNDIAAAPTRS
jgi:phosphoribosylamine--glycine ligase